MISWPINDAFLSVIEAAEQQIRDAGYYLKYGIEVNLTLLSRIEAEKFRNRNQSSILSGWRGACREQFARDITQSAQSSEFLATASEVYLKLKEIADRHRRHPTEGSAEWLANWGATCLFYKDATDSKNSEQATLAQKNFMIAAIHLLPQQLGGLDGIIEQRFASEHYGYGWWDGRNILELRTMPVQGYRATIENYHHVLWRLQSAVEKFGLVPALDHALAQVHFSLWRESDNTNIMESDDDDSLAIRKAIIENMYKTFREIPYGNFSSFFDANPVSDDSFAGSARTNVIRTCADNWELRMPGHSAGVTHLARDIFYINSIIAPQLASYGPSSEEEDKLYEEQVEQEIYMNNMLGIGTSARKAEKIRKAVVAADSSHVACPFKSCIESAWLGKNGELQVPGEVIGWNYRQMRKAISRYEVDLFSGQYDGEDEAYNLDTAYGWQLLFQEIRVHDDLTLDLSGIHPELARHFDGLSITAIRRDLHMPACKFELDENRRRFSDIVKTHFLERGVLRTFGDGQFDAQREIFGFIRQQNSSLSPQEATNYLIVLLEKAGWRRNDGGISFESVKEAVEEFLLETMLQPLDDIRRYRKLHLDILAPFFDESDIINSMRSYRQQMLAAIPDAAHYDPLEMVGYRQDAIPGRPPTERYNSAETADFFRRFNNVLRDPAKLYSFAYIKWPLISMASDNVRVPTLLEGQDPDAIQEVMERVERLITEMKEQPSDVQEIMEFMKNGGNKDGRQPTSSDAPSIDKHFYDQAYPMGEGLAKVAAAMQVDEKQSRAILSQYAEQAVSLTQTAKKASKFKNSVTSHFEFSFLQGIQEGIVDQSQRLLSDQNMLAELRRKASARNCDT